MPGSQWYETSPGFELDPALAQVGSPSSASHHSTDILAAPMGRRNRRSWEVRLHGGKESISPFYALNNSNIRLLWVRFPRVLQSLLLERGYIYETRLYELGHKYTPCNLWEYSCHFGVLKAIGFVNIYVTMDPAHTPFPVTLLVLPGPPPPGGVDFIIGKLDLTAAYNGRWTPGWSAEQAVLYGTGRGHDTLQEMEMLRRINYQGPLLPPFSR